MNIGVRVSKSLPVVPLGVHLGVGWLGCVVTPCLTFPGPSMQQLPRFTFPSAMYKGSHFSTSSRRLLFACLFENSHPTGALCILVQL